MQISCKADIDITCNNEIIILHNPLRISTVQEGGSVARLILIVLGDHGQTSDAKARSSSNQLVKWYQKIPSIPDHPIGPWKSLKPPTNWHSPRNQLQNADRIDMAGRHAGHDKTWKSVALGLDYVASGAHIHEQIMANLGCPANKKYLTRPEGSRGYD